VFGQQFHAVTAVTIPPINDRHPPPPTALTLFVPEQSIAAILLDDKTPRNFSPPTISLCKLCWCLAGFLNPEVWAEERTSY